MVLLYGNVKTTGYGGSNVLFRIATYPAPKNALPMMGAIQWTLG